MKKFFKTFWKMCRGNLVLKIVAVLFAIILWSYVLSQTNPTRVKEVEDVPVAGENMTSLVANDLAISGDLTEILSSVDIRVSISQNDLKNLNNKNVKAYIDFSTISGPGTYPLDIKVNLPYGQLLEVNPSKVTLKVDKNKTRPIPVNVITEGSVPAGYYAFDPIISPGIINIQGAMTYVQQVVSARCTVNLNGLTKGYSKSSEVELLDADGNVVDPAPFSGQLPSVIVNLSVLPVKEVDVDVEGSIVGKGSLAPGYEITNTSCNPSKVRIVGEGSLLDGISSVQLFPFSVAGSNTDVIMPASFAPPEGVTVLDVEKAEVTVNIREKTEQKTYKSVAIKTRNLSPGLAASISPSSVDVTVLAGESLMSKLLRSNIVPYVDLDGLTEGTYSLKIYFELPAGFAPENFTPSALTVNVALRRK